MFTREELRVMATPASFSRGQAYFEEGAVGRIRHRTEDNFYSAIVSGSADYGVELSLAEDGDGPDFFCNCPYNYEGICKHSVALGLAVLEEHETATAGPPPKISQKQPKPPVGAPGATAPPATAAPSAAELERALKEVAKPDKLKFLEQHLRQQPNLASAFVRHFYGSPSPADPLDADPTLPPLNVLREPLRLALTRLRFDYETLHSPNEKPLPVNYGYNYVHRPELMEQAIGIVYGVLRPVAATIGEALAAGRLAEALRRLQGAWAGIQDTMKPAADVFWLFSGSYSYIVSQSWLALLHEAQVFTQLAETPFGAGEATRCVPALVRPVLEKLEAVGRRVPDKYAPYAPPLNPLGGEQLLLAAAANPSLAPLLSPVLQAHEVRQTPALRLQLAAGLHNWKTWAKLAAEEAKYVPAVAEKLLRFHLERAERPALLEAATTLLGRQQQVVSAFVLTHVAPVEDRLLYVQALTYRVLQEQDFADFEELTGLWELEERQQFVAQVLKKSKQNFRTLFRARILAAERRGNFAFGPQTGLAPAPRGLPHDHGASQPRRLGRIAGAADSGRPHSA